jgi:hypothetical protein
MNATFCLPVRALRMMYYGNDVSELWNVLEVDVSKWFAPLIVEHCSLAGPAFHYK